MKYTCDPQQAMEYFRARMSFSTGPVELSHLMKRGEALQIVDVRRAEDFAQGHIPGAINLPMAPGREMYHWGDLSALRKDTTSIVYCYTQVCHTAAAAAFEFARRGYPVKELEGGFETWKQKGLPIANADPRENKCTTESPSCNCVT